MMGNSADAAADHENRAVLLDFAGRAQRPEDVVDAVALVELAKRRGGFADGLEDHADAAAFAVVLGNSQRNTFPRLVHAQDAELPGMSVASDLRRVDPDVELVGRKGALGKNLEHVMSPYRYKYSRWLQEFPYG